MKTTDVRVWGIRQDARSKKASYQVRWRVSTATFPQTFRTKALADSFRSKLIRAMRDGEEFDTETGLPDSLAEKPPSLTWYAFALKYLAMKWPHAASNTRDGMNEALAQVTMAFLDGLSGRPDERLLRTALRRWAFVLPGPTDREVPPEIGNALDWVARASRPLGDLAKPPEMLAVLNALKLKLDGTPAAAETVRRKKNTFVNAMKYAVDLGEFADNPVTAARWQKPEVVTTVDPRVVANPAQAESLLTAVSYVGRTRRSRGPHLRALFAGMYYGAFRPAEAVGLAEPDCTLPETGWGRVLLHRTRPTVGKRWTDSGETHDDRGLKNRPEQETRPVPIPPRLVAILREHMDTFGTADDGRLFFNERGGLVASCTYYRAWHEARALGLPPEQVASPLAGRPYDLRHSALSTWLNAGVDPTEVAERAGNSVEVLFARYAKCLFGRHEVANRRIEELLREYM
ncbi:tyrosine-type recombinase/integrase [Streptomyces radicis]|uniref:Site-specific integrase n=1 Tax=Streptomyces radicis TaxID=1750517 RepID=A0A3A9WNS1_9ACTN|nr:tyrosine-type recombinase/integrase [Streptomyces radicis]RKN09396.1 site-specific integrase [Streptomyces radicis]RKN23006.1 site-specific integrase [Streptomyces radicis]